MKRKGKTNRKPFTKDNYMDALDYIPYQYQCEDPVMLLLGNDLKDKIKDFLFKTHSISELRCDMLFLGYRFFNFGYIRGVQAERSRRHKQAMKKTFEDKPELLQLFQELLQMPAEQRAPVVDGLTQFFRAASK